MKSEVQNGKGIIPAGKICIFCKARKGKEIQCELKVKY
jgi:hypothetical protein